MAAEKFLALRLPPRLMRHLVEALDYEYDALINAEMPTTDGSRIEDKFPFWRRRMSDNRELWEEAQIALLYVNGIRNTEHTCKVARRQGGLNDGGTVLCWELTCGCGHFRGLYALRDQARSAWKRHAFEALRNELRIESGGSEPST